MSNIPFPIQFPAPNPKHHTAPSPPSTTSKILPFICPKTTPRSRPHLTALSDNDEGCNKTPQSNRATGNETHLHSKPALQNQFKITTTNESLSQSAETPTTPRLHKFPAVGAAPYIPVRHLRPHHGIAPPVTIRNAIPVFSAPPLPIPHVGITQPNQLLPQFGGLPTMCGVAPPVTIRQAVPVYSAPNIPKAAMKPVGSLIPSKEERGHAIPVISTPEDLKSPMKPPSASAATEDGKVEEKFKELQI